MAAGGTWMVQIGTENQRVNDLNGNSLGKLDIIHYATNSIN